MSKLKFKELILQVITGNTNPDLTAYSFSLTKEEKTNLKQVMMSNYHFNLSQDEFAQLTNRSISSFKQAFQQLLLYNYSLLTINY